MEERRARVVRILVASLGMVALLIVGTFYFAAGLVAPGWAVVVLIAFWALLVVLGIVWFRQHPLWILGLPIVALGVIVAAVSLGERFLGWQA